MECFKQKWCRNNGSSTAIKTIYAGWIVLVLVLVDVPVTISNPDVRLSYDQIYNSTTYAQIPQNILTESFSSRGNSITNFNRNSHIRENTKDNNEVFKFNDKYEISSNEGLLVGFAHDPFRESIPEADYAKGIRTVNPEVLNKDRGKRGVTHLYNMLTCSTGCDPISYKGYGCYCGFLGSGRPTDGIDNCCKLHDECYENVYCPFYTVYFQPYYWKCYHGQPLCALENYKTSNQVVNGCAGRLCECDRRFAMCVRKYSCPRGRPLCKSSPLRLLQNILMFK